MSETGSGARQILRRALEELKARERQLIAFEGELRETRAAIKVIEKALPRGAAAISSPPAPDARAAPAASEPAEHASISTSSPRARFTHRVVELVASATGPMSKEQIAIGLDRADDVYLATILTHAVQNGSSRPPRRALHAAETACRAPARRGPRRVRRDGLTARFRNVPNRRRIVASCP